MKHRLRSNFNMDLETIESELRIAEEIDCKSGVIGYRLTLKTHDLSVTLDSSYGLKGDRQLKYYRNEQLVKHILNGETIIDSVADGELCTDVNLEDSAIRTKTIVKLDFSETDAMITEKTSNEKKNDFVIQKDNQNQSSELQNQVITYHLI